MHFQPPYKLKSFNLLDYTWKVYKANFVLFLQLSATALLPLIIFQIAFDIFRVSVPDRITSIIDLAQSAWALLPMLATIIVTENMMQEGPPLAFRQAIKKGASHWLHAFGLYFALGAAVSVVIVPIVFLVMIAPSIVWILFILVIGAILVGNYLQFIIQMIALRSDQPGNPISRSWLLVKGQWWTAFGRNLLLDLILGGVSLLVIYPLLSLYEKSPELITIILYLYAILINPILFIYQTLLFRMLEARKDNTPADMVATEPTQVPE